MGQRYDIAAIALAFALVGQPSVWAQQLPTAPVPRQPDAAALDRATALNQQGLELYQAGRYSEAEPLFQQALAIRRQQLGDNHPTVATSLTNLAGLYYAQGNYAVTEDLLQQSLQITEATLGPNDPLVAILLNNLAELYKDNGSYAVAQPLYQRSIQIMETALGPDDPYVARGLTNLAGFYISQGDYTLAEPLLQRSIQIQQTTLGLNHPDLANSLNSLATLYESQGNDRAAVQLYQRSLQINEVSLGVNHPYTAAILNNLANLHKRQGNYITALSLHERALEIWETTRGINHPDVAITINNLARIHFLQGNYIEAKRLYQRSLEIIEEALEPNHPHLALIFNNLALVHQSLGNYSSAETFLQQALQIDKSTFGSSHPNVALSFNNLSALYQLQGDLDNSVHFLAQGMDIQELHFERNLAALNDSQRQAYAATLFGTTQNAISLHIQATPNSPEAAELALTTLLRRKGRILDAGTSSLQVLRQNLTPDDQVTLDQLTETQRQLANLTFNPPPNLLPEQYRTRLEVLEAEANELEATLARRSATFRAEITPIEINTVTAKLPDNSVLVEYILYSSYNPQNPHNPYGTDRYAAYLLFPNGRIEAVDLGEAAEIDAAVQSFVSLLQDTRADLQRGATITLELDPARVATATDAIRSLVFDPIAPYLQGRSHLLISPDAQLNLLPFEALQPETGGDYLVQQYQISYLNTGRDLVRFGVIPPSRNPAVLVGNPNYDTATVQVASSRGDSQRATVLGQLQFGPLPGTAAELTALEPLFPNAAILEGDEATENALKQVQSPRILHIATHGFFLADVEREQADSRGFGLSTRGDSLTPGIPVGVAVENPLLRSGLALAGFNTRSSGDEDGVLTALEASQLNLFGTQLVVLSACDTGLGDVANGEGVYGLRRAFGIAGAETQLLSLWQVSDFGTQSLMARYYEKLMAGMGRSEALRAVQLEMIAEGDQYSHPYYWAAFVLAGDWRPLQ